jgi:twitching motility two-component system response regulator PilH
MVEGNPTTEDQNFGQEAGADGVIPEPKDQLALFRYLQAEGERYRVTCPECQTSFHVHGPSGGGSRVKAKCPHCHYLFGILPDEMEPVSAAPPHQEGAKILVVEDTEFFRVYLTDLLTEAGFRVTTVKDGMEALERLDAERPDLVVTDLLMPRVNGFELCRKIKTHPTTASLPVIMMTEVYTKKHYQTEAHQEHKADDFLTKPFRPEDLLTRIRRLIPPSLP